MQVQSETGVHNARWIRDCTANPASDPQHKQGIGSSQVPLDYLSDSVQVGKGVKVQTTTHKPEQQHGGSDDEIYTLHLLPALGVIHSQPNDKLTEMETEETTERKNKQRHAWLREAGKGLVEPCLHSSLSVLAIYT
jgi:hypothetical protein